MRNPIFIPKKTTPRSYEFSPYRTQRDSHSTLKQWKDSVEFSGQINSLTQWLQAMERELKALQAPRLNDFGFHPFKIYSLPAIFRPATVTGSFNPFDNWRIFKIRNGEVLTKFAASVTGSSGGASNTGSTAVFGTDGVFYPDTNILPSPYSYNDITAPESSSRFYLWIEAFDTIIPDTGSYIIQYGVDPTNVGVQNKWATFPSASGNHFIIGYVDTLTSQSVHQAFVRQYLRTDVVSTPRNYVSASICRNNAEEIWYIDMYKSGSAH